MVRTDPASASTGIQTATVSRSHYFAALPAVLALALFWPFGGGKEIHMTANSQVPAAHGVIHVKSTGDGNKQLEIKTRSLAKPAALTPPEQVYVVWIQPSGQAPTNAGALKVDGNLNGDLTTVTPYKDFKVFITAENYAQLRQPSGMTVLSAHVSG